MADKPPAYSDQPLLHAIIILFITVSTITFLLRLASLRIGREKWQLGDMLALLGWLTFNAFMGLTLGMTAP
jgi:hypothetical protein